MSARITLACDKRDIERAAYSMIANHGGAAAAIAQQRAHSLAACDAADAQVTWQRIATAIHGIQRRPHPGSNTRH